jgi:predicted glutamine amidotransferase
MCGLVGVVGSIYEPEKKAFEFMLKLDIKRGPHSTGVAQVERGDDKVTVIKDVGNTYDFLRANYDEYYNTKPMVAKKVPDRHLKLMLGHNRWATVGEVNKDNAHPFEAGNIVGAHNGTLPDFQRQRLDDYEYYNTDSEALMHNIDVHGLKGTIGKLSAGAWALTFYNRQNDTFNLLRNKERPLFFAWTKDKRTMFYASEAWMIDVACDEFNIDVPNIELLKVDTHVVIPFNAYGAAYEEITTESVKGFTPPPAVHMGTSSTSGGTGSTNWNALRADVNAANHQNFVKPEAKVIPFAPSKKNTTEQQKKFSKASDCFKEARALENTIIRMWVENDWTTGKHGHKYIRAWEETTATEVRIHVSETPQHHHILKLLNDVNFQLFSARARKAKLERGTPYLLVELDSIKGIDMFADDNDDDGLPPSNTTTDVNQIIDTLHEKHDTNMYKVYNGYVEREEFLAQTHNGCCWCSTAPAPAEHLTLRWLGNREFLCDDCSVNNPYLAQYGIN